MISGGDEMAPKDSYQEWLKKDYNAMIDSLELQDQQKHFMKSRWLEQVLWMEGKSAGNQRWYYRFRVAAIVGGVIVPALVGLNLGDGMLPGLVQSIIFFVSLLVAISIAVEEFFHFGDRWRHYRSTVELLKSEGWNYFQLCGPYESYDHHPDGFPPFAQRVEEILKLEMNVFIAEVTKEKKQPEDNG